MTISAATVSDVEAAMRCLVSAFAEDPITGFLLESGPHYPARLTQFFALLMRARLELGMPVLVARDGAEIQGAIMGYSTQRPAWPPEMKEAWNRFEAAIPGLTGRMAVYDDLALRYTPPVPHYYLGVIGTDPGAQGQGLGRQLLQAFCARSAADPLSSGVYLETANPSNVSFYEKAGFKVTGQGALGNRTLWCMYLDHAGAARSLPTSRD